MRRSALMCRGYSCVSALRHFGRHFPVDADPLPGLQIQQAPDAVAMIALVRAMLSKQLTDCLFSEQSAIKRARFEQHLFQIVELRSGQPIGPGRRETHFLAVHDIAGQQIFHRFFQNKFPCQARESNTRPECLP